MSGNNATILKVTLERFRDEKVDKMQFWMVGLCEKTVKEAVNARRHLEGARDFTGNLLNSIACALYRDGNLVHASYSKDEVSPPIRGKMTYPKVYNFRPAYDGDEVRNAGPSPKSPSLDVVTGQKQGPQDALDFVRNFKPDKKALLQMVLAYTTEYATFVEAIRGTTGYFQTMEFISIEAPKILNAKL